MTTRRKDRKPKLKFGDKVTVIASDCRWKGRHEVVTGFEGKLILCVTVMMTGMSTMRKT